MNEATQQIEQEPAAPLPPLPVLEGAAPPPPRRRGIRVPGGKHSPLVAALLSLVVIGTGQFYNRQWAKGATLLGTVVATSLIAEIVNAPSTEGASRLFALALVVMSVSDARTIARRLRRGETVQPWQFS